MPKADGGILNARQSIIKRTIPSSSKKHDDGRKKLWNQLRCKKFSNLRFRRQVVLGNYIVDFISYEPKIVIEVDGSQHIDQADYDIKRTIYLESMGYKVLRYWNNEILSNIEKILGDIWNHCF